MVVTMTADECGHSARLLSRLSTRARLPCWCYMCATLERRWSVMVVLQVRGLILSTIRLRRPYVQADHAYNAPPKEFDSRLRWCTFRGRRATIRKGVDAVTAADGTTTTETTSVRTPAYSSFTSFQTLLDKLQENGLPQVFDRSYFGNASGGAVAQTRGTLRFFDLIDDDYKPTDLLRQLVGADTAGRKSRLTEMARERYQEEIRLGEQRGTHGQLVALLRERNLTGATAAKAITFFLHLAEYADLPRSPFFTQGRAATNGTTSTGGARRASKKRRPSVAPDPEAPTAPAGSVDAKRLEYIDMLMELARDSTPDADAGEIRKDLLNRIENALRLKETAREKANPEETEGG